VIRRLLLGYVAIVLVLAGSLAVPFGLVFAQHQREAFAVALERDAVVIGAFYEDALQGDMPINPEPAIAYSERTGVRVVVVDKSGNSVVDTDGGGQRSFTSRHEIVTSLSGNRFSGTRYSQTLGAELYVVSVPVASGTDVFGAVRLTVLNEDVVARVRRMWLSLGAIVLVAVIATAVVALTIARSITRPVADLREAAARISHGDLSARSSVADAPPELEELANTFDHMAARLERLVESQRAFVADASHQLRTPLTVLRLRLENLEATACDRDVDDIGSIILEVERLSSMVDQLLELSRTGAARAIPVDVPDVVLRRVGLWKAVGDDRGIALGFDVGAESTCWGEIVPGGLEQILDNLIDNAIRYSQDDGAVMVTVGRASDGFCVVEVSDNGPGVSAENMEKLFERFWRGNSDQPGTGLGLAIVAHLVGRSGGSVTAAPGTNGGLTISVRLPACDGPENTADANSSSP
jgi:signal transduction histidine kinase